MAKRVLLKIVFWCLVLALLIMTAATLNNRFFPIGADSVRSQTFFEQFVVAGGPIVWFVLLPMSVVTVFLVFEHALTIRKSKLVPPGVGEEIAKKVKRLGPQDFTIEIADDCDFVSVAVYTAVTKAGGDWLKVRMLLTESLQDQAMELFRKIEWLNLIGNVSPMVGLFGTVFGMIILFNDIVQAGGQPRPPELAGGISVALVTTFWGLLIAIPALALHGIFRNGIETLVNTAVAEADCVMPHIRVGIKKQIEFKKALRNKGELKR